MASTLSGPSLMASKAAVAAALADQAESKPSLEPGELEEVDMQAQADGIRTVFSDPTNFNVKVSLACKIRRTALTRRAHSASSLLCMDAVVRFSCYQRSQSASDSHVCLPSNSWAANTWSRCRTGLDGRYQASDQFR